MKTVRELIEEIYDAELSTPNDVDDEVEMDGFVPIDEINYEEHRWYTVSTIVYGRKNEFIGVRGPTMLKSEEMGYRDTGYTCEAFEMEQIPSFTYREKE